MKGTLVKEYEDFYLISDKEIQKGDEYVKLNNRPRTLLLGTTISHVTKVSKLSLKNCQAIELGYDLDELAKADADLRYNQPGEEDLWLTRVTGIEYGFNLALEILGDKKFSEEKLSLNLQQSFMTKILGGVKNKKLWKKDKKFGR